MKLFILEYFVPIVKGLVLMYGAWWGFLYYSGRVQSAGEVEKQRKSTTEKYGKLLITAIVACLCSGIYFLSDTLFRIVKYYNL